MNQLTIAILGTFHLHTCSARSLHYQAEEEVIKVHDGAAAWEVDGGLVQLTNDTSPPHAPWSAAPSNHVSPRLPRPHCPQHASIDLSAP